MTAGASCWCGEGRLEGFSSGYLRCPGCETLISRRVPAGDLSRVTDEDRDFYGREYWFSYQERELGTPNILARARADLPERCLHWLGIALKYRVPPARVLEVGCGHGGFVAMLRWAGLDAMGLEVSPWVVRFASGTFEVPVLLGPVEDQPIEPASLDAIALMDVLEHLQDPMGTMRRCLGLLKPDGILLVQTPSYPAGGSHEAMVAAGDRFLECLQDEEHLYLFSRRAVCELFRRLGAPHCVFEPPVFPYDMLVVVSRAPLVVQDAAAIERALGARPSGRMVQALLDLGAQVERQREEIEAQSERLEAAEADRAQRRRVIEEQGRRLGEVEAERNNLRAEAAALREHVGVIEADRAARLAVIEEQGRRLGEVEAERNNLRAEAAALREHEADLVAQLEAIREQERRFSAQTLVVEAQDQQIRTITSQLRALQQVFRTLQGARAYRVLRRLGRWRWVEQAIAQSSTDSLT